MSTVDATATVDESATVDNTRKGTVDTSECGDKRDFVHGKAVLEHFRKVLGPFPAENQDLTTVVMSIDTTVAKSIAEPNPSYPTFLSTVDPLLTTTVDRRAGQDLLGVAESAGPSLKIQEEAELVDRLMSTVEPSVTPTVGMLEESTSDSGHTGAVGPETNRFPLSEIREGQGSEVASLDSKDVAHGVAVFDTVSKADQATVAIAIEPPLAAPLWRRPKDAPLWITEQGDLVPQARVKRIRLAQDVINSAEESVYDTLWSAKGVQTDRESHRIVQVGYDYLVKRTRLSKKTIQRIIAKLLDKDFIVIERQADIYKRTSTVYRVFSYKTVLDRHVQKGRSYVAKMGPGFSYVHAIDDPRSSLPSPTANMSTVDMNVRSTVVNPSASTPDNGDSATVVELNPPTVVRPATTYIGINDLDTPKTSSSSATYRALSQYGTVDDDVLALLVRSCKQHAQDCTEEEIVHFIEAKGSLVRVKESRIYSPIGFLLTAVPKCFAGDAFKLYREEERKRREVEAAIESNRQAELDDWKKEQETRLADPSVSDDEKRFIRDFLGVS